MEQKYYTESEVAIILKVSKSTLQSWRWRGGIGPKFKKVGSRVLYPIDELQKYLDQFPLVQSTSQYTFVEAK